MSDNETKCPCGTWACVGEDQALFMLENGYHLHCTKHTSPALTVEQREALAYAKGYEKGLLERNELLAVAQDSLKALKIINAKHGGFDAAIERSEAVIGRCE